MSGDLKIESRFETIFNHVNEGILIADQDGKIILVNPRVNEMFGYPESDLVGEFVEKLVPMEHHSRHADYRESYMRHPVKRPMGKNMTLHGMRSDQSLFPVEISLSYYETGEGIYVIAFIIDISARFAQQEKIRKMNTELKVLNETLERKVGERTLVLREALHELENSRDELSKALEKEKELNEMKSRFISMASHEFRTPLSTILSSISLIGKYINAEEQEKRDKHITRIKNAVNGLTEILNDFLSIGRLEEGRIMTNRTLHDIAEIVQETVNEVSLICKPGQTIQFVADGKVESMVDRQMLRNVMFNLLSNAIKFSPENTIIEVSLSTGNENIQIAVSDHGIGISDEDQANLFGRFFRARNAANIQGTGLGLHIVTKYLELMNGDIRCESILDSGTTFYITLPIIKENNEDDFAH